MPRTSAMFCIRSGAIVLQVGLVVAGVLVLGSVIAIFLLAMSGSSSEYVENATASCAKYVAIVVLINCLCATVVVLVSFINAWMLTRRNRRE